MTAIPARPAKHPSCWRGPDLANDPAWRVSFGSEERDDLARIVARLRGRRIDALTPSDVPPRGPLAEATRRWRTDLMNGRGFVLVRGLDADAFSPSDLELAFVVVGLHLGALAPQNLKGELITNICDTGADPSLLSTRLYTTRAEQDFHTDSADIIGLLCRRTARLGGVSRIASSGEIVAEVRRSRPDLYPVLFQDFPWHYGEEGTPALWITSPICTVSSGDDGSTRLSTFFIPWFIRRSQKLPDAPRLTAAQSEAIALLETLANDPRFYLDMTLGPGDMQWLLNAAILHKRTAYEDFDEPDRKRHLLRLWLNTPERAEGAGVSSRGCRRRPGRLR